MTVLADHASPYRAQTLPHRGRLQSHPSGRHYLLCEAGSEDVIAAFVRSESLARHRLLGPLPLPEAESVLGEMTAQDHLLVAGREPFCKRCMRWRGV